MLPHLEKWPRLMSRLASDVNRGNMQELIHHVSVDSPSPSLLPSGGEKDVPARAQLFICLFHLFFLVCCGGMNLNFVTATQ